MAHVKAQQRRRDSGYYSPPSIAFKTSLSSKQGRVTLKENLEAWLEDADKSQTSQAWVEGRYINGILAVTVSFDVPTAGGVVHTEASVRPVLADDGSRGRLVISVVKTPQSGPGAAGIHVDFPEDGAALPKYPHAVTKLVIIDKSMDDDFDVLVSNFGSEPTKFKAKENTLVGDFKDQVYEKFRYPSCQQRLLYQGKDMQDERYLGDYGVKKQPTSPPKINCVTRLRGG